MPDECLSTHSPKEIGFHGERKFIIRLEQLSVSQTDFPECGMTTLPNVVGVRALQGGCLAVKSV